MIKSDKEYLVYEGKYYGIEWYYDSKSESQARKYYENLSVDERIQLLKLIKTIGDFGAIKNITKFRNEGDKIFAFKPKPDRYLCFFVKNKKIVITNAFRKKQEKLPVKEKEKAIKCMNEYMNRVRAGEYYE